MLIFRSLVHRKARVYASMSMKRCGLDTHELDESPELEGNHPGSDRVRFLTNVAVCLPLDVLQD